MCAHIVTVLSYLTMFALVAAGTMIEKQLRSNPPRNSSHG
jgi:hypothetical protein